jgi:hypothetical protein
MPAANIIRLRALLSEKFSGLGLQLGESSAATSKVWPTGLPQIDEPLQGGLPKGALSEIVSPGTSSGAATLMHALLRRAAQENQFIALIDGNDSLDVTQIEQGTLARLLWVRARSANEALKACDLILRDNNLSLVLLDLKVVAENELRKILATIWYRFQRVVEEKAIVCVVFTPRGMVPAAQARITLQARFSLDAMERDAVDLLRELKFEISLARHFQDTARQSVA